MRYIQFAAFLALMILCAGGMESLLESSPAAALAAFAAAGAAALWSGREAGPCT